MPEREEAGLTSPNQIALYVNIKQQGGRPFGGSIVLMMNTAWSRDTISLYFQLCWAVISARVRSAVGESTKKEKGASPSPSLIWFQSMSLWKRNVRRLQESTIWAIMSARSSVHIWSIAVVRCSEGRSGQLLNAIQQRGKRISSWT